MEKILIVGGTGFLGFHLAKYYSKKKSFKTISLSRKKPKKISPSKLMLGRLSYLINITNSLVHLIL